MSVAALSAGCVAVPVGSAYYPAQNDYDVADQGSTPAGLLPCHVYDPPGYYGPSLASASIAAGAGVVARPERARLRSRIRRPRVLPCDNTRCPLR